MSLNLKFRTCFITFILVVSSLSLFVISPENAKADDNSIEELMLQLYGIHPFITAGWYEYNGSELLEIKGNIIFNLYFTSTLLTQIRYKDDLKVAIYSWNPNSLLPFPRQVRDGNATITLKPELFGDTVQSCTVEIENISINLTEGEFLIFAVEIIQSGKPIGNIIERIYEYKLKSRLELIGEFLNKSSNEQFKEIGATIIETLNITEEYGITGEEVASLVDSFSSSSFVYNSADYPSSVYLPLNSGGNMTLYFHSVYSEDFEDEDYEIMGKDIMLEKVPNGTAVTWPARLMTIDSHEPEFNSEEWMMWLGFWLEYIIQPPEEEDENIVTYYLDDKLKLVTDEPEGYSPSRISIRDTKTWKSSSLERNKIIKNATAELYLYYPRLFTLRKINVKVTLLDGDNPIAFDEKKLDRTNLLELLQRGPDYPTTFTFEDAIDKQIWNGNNISLKVSVSEGPLFSLRHTYLLCDSKDYPSSLTLKLEETDNIEISEKLENKKVIPGGSAEFILNITSKYEDTVKIEVIPEDPDDPAWSVEHPQTVDIAENGSVSVHIFVNSTDNTINAEDDEIKLTFIATGRTGIDSDEASVEVSKDAVEYDIIVTVPPGKEIKHGRNDTYIFKIKNNNTGVWPDSYKVKASSEHNWSVYVSYDKEKDVEIGEELTVDVSVSVPWYTSTASDVLKLTVISKESDEEFSVTVTVTTTVINPNLLESLYHFFESAAEDIGLDELLGSYAAAFLIFLVIFLILIFVISAVYLIKKKFVEIVCLERIKDITPDEEATFDITIQNPSKRSLTYEIRAEVINLESKSWDISLDKESVVVESKQSSVVVLTVKPTDYVKSDDWVEVKVIAKGVEKKKSARISTLTTIKEGKTEIQIAGVFHWPRVFKKGDRVETSFRLRNMGNVSASDISIILYVNGEEKNKVEGITIPRGGYAEIEIPWIAVKGKNDVNIVVK